MNLTKTFSDIPPPLSHRQVTKNFSSFTVIYTFIIYMYFFFLAFYTCSLLRFLHLLTPLSYYSLVLPNCWFVFISNLTNKYFKPWSTYQVHRNKPVYLKSLSEHKLGQYSWVASPHTTMALGCMQPIFPSLGKRS